MEGMFENIKKILYKPSTPNAQIKNFTKIYKLVAGRNRAVRTACEPTPDDPEKKADEEEPIPEVADPARDHVRRLAKTLFYTPVVYSARRSYWAPISKARRPARCRVNPEPLTYASDLSKVLEISPVRSNVRCRSEGVQSSHYPFRKKKVKITYQTRGNKYKYGVWNLEDMDKEPPTHSHSADEGVGKLKELQLQRQSLTQFENHGKPSVPLTRTVQTPSQPKKFRYELGSRDNLGSKTNSSQHIVTKPSPEPFIRHDVWNDRHSIAVASPKLNKEEKIETKFKKIDQEPDKSRAFNTDTSVPSAAHKPQAVTDETENDKFALYRAKHGMGTTLLTYPKGNDKTSQVSRDGAHHVLSFNSTRPAESGTYTVRSSDHTVKFIPSTYPIRGKGEREETLGTDAIAYVKRTQWLQAQPPPPSKEKIEEKKIEEKTEYSISSSAHSVEFIPKSYPRWAADEDVLMFNQKRNECTASSTFSKVDDTIKKDNNRLSQGESPISRILRQTARRVDLLDNISGTKLGDDISVCRTDHSVEIIPKQYLRRHDDDDDVAIRQKVELPLNTRFQERNKRLARQTGGGWGGNEEDPGFDFTICRNEDTVEIIPLAYQKKNASDHNLGREEENVDRAWKNEKTAAIDAYQEASESNPLVEKLVAEKKTESRRLEAKTILKEEEEAPGMLEATPWVHRNKLESKPGNSYEVGTKAGEVKTNSSKLDGGHKYEKRTMEQNPVKKSWKNTTENGSPNSPTPWIYQKKLARDPRGKLVKPVALGGQKGKKNPRWETFTVGNKEYSICKSGNTIEFIPSTTSTKSAVPRRAMTASQGIVRPAREVYSLNSSPKKMRLIDATEGVRASRPSLAKNWEFVISKSDHSIEIASKKSKTGDAQPRARPAGPPEEVVRQVVNVDLGEERPADCLVSREEHSIGFTPIVYGRPRRAEQDDGEKEAGDGPPGRLKYRLAGGPSGGTDEIKRKFELASRKARQSPPSYSPSVRLKPWEPQKAGGFPEQPGVSLTAKVNQVVSDSAGSVPNVKPVERIVTDTQPKYLLEIKEPTSSQCLQQRDVTANAEIVQESKPTKERRGNEMQEKKDKTEKHLKVTSHQRSDDNHQKDDRSNSEVPSAENENKLTSRIFSFYKSRFEKNKHKTKQQETKTLNPYGSQVEEGCPTETTKPDEGKAFPKLPQVLAKVDNESAPQERPECAAKISSIVTTPTNKARGEKTTPGAETITSCYKSQPVLTQEEPDAQERNRPYMSQPTLTKFKFVSPKTIPKPNRLPPTSTEEKVDSLSSSQKQNVATTLEEKEKSESLHSSIPKWQVQRGNKTNENQNHSKEKLYRKLLESYKFEVKSNNAKDPYKKDQPSGVIEKKADSQKEQVSVKNYVREIEQREKGKVKDASANPKNLLENFVTIKKGKEALSESTVPVKRSNTISTIMKQYEFVAKKPEEKEATGGPSVDLMEKPPSSAPKESHPQKEPKTVPLATAPQIAKKTEEDGKTGAPRKPSVDLMERTKKEVVNWKSIDKVVSEALQTKPPSPTPKESHPQKQPKTVTDQYRKVEARATKKPSADLIEKTKKEVVNWKSINKVVSEALQTKPPSPAPKELHPSKEPKIVPLATATQKKTEEKEVARATKKPSADLLEKTKKEVVNWKSINKVVSEALQTKPPSPAPIEQQTQRHPKTIPLATASPLKPCNLKQETIQHSPKIDQRPKSPSKEILINVATKIDNPLRFSIILHEDEPPKQKSAKDPTESQDEHEVDVNIIEANRPTIKKEKPPLEDIRKKKERSKKKDKDIVFPPAVVDKDLKLQQEIRSMLKDLTKTVSGDLLKEEKETQKMIRELKSKIESEKNAMSSDRDSPIKAEETKSKAMCEVVDLAKPVLVAVKEKLHFQHRPTGRPPLNPQAGPPKGGLPPKEPVVRVEKEQGKVATTTPEVTSKPGQTLLREGRSSEAPKDPILNIEKTAKRRPSKTKLKFKPKRSKVLKKKVSNVLTKTPSSSKANFYRLEERETPIAGCDEGDQKTTSLASPPTKDRTFTTSSHYHNMLNAAEKIDTPQANPSTENRRNLLQLSKTTTRTRENNETDSGKAPSGDFVMSNAEPETKATVEQILPKKGLHRFNKKLATLHNLDSPKTRKPFFKIHGVTVEKKLDIPETEDTTTPKKPPGEVRVSFRPELCMPFANPSKVAASPPKTETNTLSKSTSEVLLLSKKPEVPKVDDYQGLKITFIEVKRQKGRDPALAQLIEERFKTLHKLYLQFCEDTKTGPDSKTSPKNQTKELIDKLRTDDKQKPGGLEK